MPLLRINATAQGLVLHTSVQPARRHLRQLANQPGPAIIMVHGYKYSPHLDSHCPHQKIFGDAPHNWPSGLQFGQGRRDEGLGIPFGWHARGPLKSVHVRATELGYNIAIMVAMLRDHCPERPVHVVAHSLGAQAVLSALAHLPAHTINRMILMTGASFNNWASEMLATPAGRTCEVLNVTSRENDLFDAAFEHLVPSNNPKDSSIGHGIDAENVVNLQIDCNDTLAALDAADFQIAAPARRICHWSAYKRKGVMTLYDRFLRAPDKLPLKLLKQIIPKQSDPRWSRLLTGAPQSPRIASPLPKAFHTLGFRSRLRTRRAKNEPAY